MNAVAKVEKELAPWQSAIGLKSFGIRGCCPDTLKDWAVAKATSWLRLCSRPFDPEQRG